MNAVVVLAALLTVGAEVLLQPLMVQLFGFETRVLNLTLALTMLGFAIGSGGFIRRIRAWCWGSAALLVLLLVAFTGLSKMGGSALGLGAVAALISVSVLPGALFHRGVYGSGEPIVRYRLINLVCAAAAPLFAIYLFAFGFHAVLALMVAGLLVCGWVVNPNTIPARLSGVWDKEACLTIALSFVAAGFLSTVIERMELLLFPTGLEFAELLTLLFLFLSVPFPRITSSRVLVGGAVAMFATLALTGPLFLLLPEARSFAGMILQNFLFLGLFLVPYLFFAQVVPAREWETPGRNHLHLSSVGSFAGFCFFSFGLGSYPFSVTLGAIALGLGGTLRLARARWILIGMVLLLSALPSVVAGTVGVVPSWIRDLHIFRKTSRLPNALSAEAPPSGVAAVSRVDGETGYLVDYPLAQQSLLGLGAYFTRLHPAIDLLKGLVVTDLLPAKGGRVLVLGLGSHLTVATLQAVLSKRPAPWSVTVVDNFPPFRDPAFREAVAARSGFRWDRAPEVTFRSEDAVTFLAREPAETYDAVVWNLTHPVFGRFNRIYTREFLLDVSRVLKPDAFLVADHYPELGMRCLLRLAAPYTYYLPRPEEYPVGLMVSSKRTLAAVPQTDSCEKISLPTFDNPFPWRLLSLSSSYYWRFPWPFNANWLSLVPPEVRYGASGSVAKIQGGDEGLWASDFPTPGALNVADFSLGDHAQETLKTLRLWNPNLNVFLERAPSADETRQWSLIKATKGEIRVRSK